VKPLRQARRLASTIASRAVEDLRPGDRAAEYASLLHAARAAGYTFVTVRELDARRRAATGPPDELLIALRHDVDIRNPAGNEMFHALETAAGAVSTTYFRLSTVTAHAKLIPRLLAAGFEVGYHFEEGATIAKRFRLRSREQVFARKHEIDDLFIRNCAAFRERWAPDLVSVSSHGDWVNRRLGFLNRDLIDADVLRRARIGFEAYEPHLSAGGAYVSDVADDPRGWANDLSLAEAIARRINPLYVLTHERRWHTNPVANLHQDAVRLLGTIAYSLPLP
jgi:hypothetical protein